MRALGPQLHTSGENGFRRKNSVFNHLVGGVTELGRGVGPPKKVEERIMAIGFPPSVKSRRHTGGDSTNPPSRLSVRMEIAMEQIKGNRNCFLLWSQKNSWKQWHKIENSLFFNMPSAPAAAVAS